MSITTSVTPIVGYGVFEIPANVCERCVLDAIETAYRLIDTAQAYHNEEAVGLAIEETSVPCRRCARWPTPSW